MKQLGRSYPECFGEAFHDGDRRIARASLDVADVRAMDAGAVGIVFLAPAFIEPKPSDIGAKALANIHPSQKTPLSTNDLQTMSDISSLT